MSKSTTPSQPNLTILPNRTSAVHIPIEKVPEVRIKRLGHSLAIPDAPWVLYWMTAFRRVRHNFALQRAVQLAEELQKPLVILEALRCNYPWACERFHQFIIDGMYDNALACASTKALYRAYVEPKPNHGKDLIEEIGRHACIVVSDDFPCFFFPAMYQAVARRLRCPLEIVDSNTIVPMRDTDRVFTVAHSYRRYMQKSITNGFPKFPVESPLECLTNSIQSLPNTIDDRYGLFADAKALKSAKFQKTIATLPIDHQIQLESFQGGAERAQSVLSRFVDNRINDYAVARNEPEQEGSSGLSPYLHFGNISPHEVFLGIKAAVNWEQHQLAKPNGKMNGFWNMGENAEAFMDQLMTWREIGFNQCCLDRRYNRFESLPDWAQKTLKDHENDPRPWVYELEQFEQSKTHDALWNAAQTQLVTEGRMHNYLRMLWGKKILHWTRSPREALSIMIELNNKYALDGRDPNSYSGIFWVLGRYDRAWGPERPIFGKIRYMTSESTRSKFHVTQFIQRYST